jgi:hypothetical protein
LHNNPCGNVSSDTVGFQYLAEDMVTNTDMTDALHLAASGTTLTNQKLKANETTCQ